MKKIFHIMLVVFVLKHSQAQTPPGAYTAFVRLADSLYLAKDYKSAAAAYSSALKSFGWKGSVNDRYNAARAWTLAENPDSAFCNLQRMADKAYYADYEKVSSDEALKSLQTDKRWEPLLNQMKTNKLPDSWFRAGSKPAGYRMYIDNTPGPVGNDVFVIKSNLIEIDGFGTIMQNSLAGKYVGKRIRMAGVMKSQDVADWAGFWLRVDGPDPTRPLSFDNMHDRSVKGSTTWKTYEIVLDVPPSATNIAFGALLSGTGEIWFGSPTFEIVDGRVPTTNKEQ